MKQNNLIFSKTASERTKELAHKNGYKQAFLRLSVSGGGCAGFSYHFDLIEDKDIDKEEDIIVSNDDAKLVVDKISFEILEGSEIDYTQELIGSAFVVKNPNAQSTCGCGTSFSI